jgi:hypothetical protein
LAKRGNWGENNKTYLREIIKCGHGQYSVLSVAKHSFRKWYENFEDYKQMGNFLTKLHNSNPATWITDYKYLITQKQIVGGSNDKAV